jgi:hypothetical protein
MLAALRARHSFPPVDLHYVDHRTDNLSRTAYYSAKDRSCRISRSKAGRALQIQILNEGLDMQRIQRIRRRKCLEKL